MVSLYLLLYWLLYWVPMPFQDFVLCHFGNLRPCHFGTFHMPLREPSSLPLWDFSYATSGTFVLATSGLFICHLGNLCPCHFGTFPMPLRDFVFATSGLFLCPFRTLSLPLRDFAIIFSTMTAHAGEWISHHTAPAKKQRTYIRLITNG